MLFATEWLRDLKPLKLLDSGLCIEGFPQESQNYVATNGPQVCMGKDFAHERNFFLGMRLGAFRHGAKHFQCLFSFSEEEETNRSLSKQKEKKRKEERKYLFIKDSFRKWASTKHFSSSELSEIEWFSSIWKYCIKENNIIFNCSSAVQFVILPQSWRNSQHQQGESSALPTDSPVRQTANSHLLGRCSSLHVHPTGGPD